MRRLYRKKVGAIRRTKLAIRSLAIALMVMALVPAVASAEADSVVESNTPPPVSFVSEGDAYLMSDEVIICWGWSSHNRHGNLIWFESSQSCTDPIERHTVVTDLQKYSEILGWYSVQIETATCRNTYGCEASGIDFCTSPGNYRIEGTHYVKNGAHPDSEWSESGPFWCS